MDHQTVDLYFESYGQGFPVIFLHGFSFESCHLGTGYSLTGKGRAFDPPGSSRTWQFPSTRGAIHHAPDG